MNTRQIVQGYFTALEQRQDWQAYFSESMTLTSYTSPIKQLTGRPAFLKGTQRFYASVATVELRSLIVEGDAACALTHYDLRSPAGGVFSSDVAEIFHVANGKIDSFAIYFDTAPFPK